jgi:putative membrane-bound dehydrogenase-like protein
MTNPWLAAGLLGGLCAARLAADNLSPQAALARMKVPPDLEVRLVACEPEVRQPICVRFDARGRMWVLQYLQYPHPAGLKAVSVDAFLRTVYDRVPEPPLAGPKGADRITICDQPDATGRFHRFHDFISDGNMISGFALGYGGVFVMQPPYLLYYPTPEALGSAPPPHQAVGAPQVLLKGFGLQDTHALANNLQFGPDGWLYGAQGSTVTSDVNACHFNQGIWRYQLSSGKFEVFAEGGGNTWGLDFDAGGNVIAGTNVSHIALHQVQGAYYAKIFGKHGELSNPYAFGYFDHIPSPSFVGGHITVGGLVYQGGELPERFEGAYIAGNLLSNRVYWHVFSRAGSSFRLETKGDFLNADDPNFRPVYLGLGPDGAIYVVDWYDQRATHVDPREDWDKTTGRVYRVQRKGAAQIGPLALDAMSSAELVALLGNKNEWYPRMARQLLAERHDANTFAALREGVLKQTGRPALESLWTLAASGGFQDALAFQALDHPDENVRAWAVRLMGDTREISPSLGERLVKLAQSEPSPVVRSQLASTAKRLPGQAALPVIRALLHRDEDAGDPMIPLLLWWAIENKAVSHREGVLGLLSSPADWRAPIVKQTILARLARRYAADPAPGNLAVCALLLSSAPPYAADQVIAGLDAAFEGRGCATPPPELLPSLEKLWAQGDQSPALTRFAARIGFRPAITQARLLLADRSAPLGQRAAVMTLLAQRGDKDAESALIDVVTGTESSAAKARALAALAAYRDPALSGLILEAYPKMDSSLKAKARGMLETRAESSLALLRSVDDGRVAAAEVPSAEVRKMSAWTDPQLGRLIFQHYGKISPTGSGLDQAMVISVMHIIPRHKGRTHLAAGRRVFQQMCASCHSLFGEGGHIGPDLTSIDRMNTQFMVDNIVSPSLTIRPEFIAYNAALTDGRSLSGFIASSDEQAVTLRDVSDQRTVIPRAQIRSLEPSSLSLMPEGLLQSLDEQQIADLFAYLQSKN